MRRNNKIIFVPVALVALFLIFITPFIHFSTMENVSFTVEYRERVTITGSNGKAESRYMVWAKMRGGGSEVFENTDSFLSLKFNSADFYGLMATGKNCDAIVNGFRAPFVSWNRNIISVDCRD
jgi:hypothetical protein